MDTRPRRTTWWARADEEGRRGSCGEHPLGLHRTSWLNTGSWASIRRLFSQQLPAIGWLPLALLMTITSPMIHAGHRPCVDAEEAGQQFNRDVCVSAHVYDVVQLADGTQFLDICSPDTPDERCRFTIVNPAEYREEVGELMKFRGEDIRVRGIVRSMHGRAGLELSHMRQFYGGAERFRANPRLLHGFSGDDARPPVHDPNLHLQGRSRGFMNSRDRQTRQVK